MILGCGILPVRHRIVYHTVHPVHRRYSTEKADRARSAMALQRHTRAWVGLIIRNPADDCVPPKNPKHEMKILPPERIKSYLTEADQHGVLSRTFFISCLSARSRERKMSKGYNLSLITNCRCQLSIISFIFTRVHSHPLAEQLREITHV